MQLDSTRIAIRERDLTEILDLALRVVRVYAWQLIVACALGAIPFALLNWWILNHWGHFHFDSESLQEQAPLYVLSMSLLVMWELPLAAAPATLLLGQAMFLQKAEVGRIFKDLLSSLPQLFTFQVLLRGILMPLVITWLLPYVSWPYLNEIVLLERNPMTQSQRGGMSTFRRSSALHSGSGGDLFARWIGSVTAACILIGALWLTIWYFGWLIGGHRQFDRVVFVVYLPIAMWTVASYFTVVRFLSYLDLRIRREGWEVELRMRAEAARLTRQVA